MQRLITGIKTRGGDLFVVGHGSVQSIVLRGDEYCVTFPRINPQPRGDQDTWEKVIAIPLNAVDHVTWKINHSA